MTRYQMFMFETDPKGNCIDFYSTDAGMLGFLSSDLRTRFGASEVESGEIAHAGEMTVYFQPGFDFRLAEHYINLLLCGNGWEPYAEGCFKLRYEE